MGFRLELRSGNEAFKPSSEYGHIKVQYDCFYVRAHWSGMPWSYQYGARNVRVKVRGVGGVTLSGSNAF